MHIFILVSLTIILFAILVVLAHYNNQFIERIEELETKLYDENQIVKQKTEDYRKARLTIQTLEDKIKSLTEENLAVNKIVQEKETTIIALEDSLAKATTTKEGKSTKEAKKEEKIVAKKTTTKKTTAKKTTTKKTSKKGE